MENLGKFGKDKITGFEGVITSEHHYLTGCTQVGMQPKATTDGILPKAQYFDINRVEIGDWAFTNENGTVNAFPTTGGCDNRERP